MKLKLDGNLGRRGADPQRDAAIKPDCTMERGYLSILNHLAVSFSACSISAGLVNCMGNGDKFML